MASWQFYAVRVVALPLAALLLQIFSLLKSIILAITEFLIPWTVPRVVRTPEARFEGLEAVGYTFKPNYVALPIGGGKTLPRVHYVDEGPRDAQETILCLHGEPSWSFLYRHMIPVFVNAGYRVIAPDFIGFGKSDKYTHPESYTHDLHTQTLRLLLDYLKVEKLTLVCQDWGGLTGLTVVKDSPHLFSRLVIMNTGLPNGVKQSGEAHLFPLVTPFLLWKSFAKACGTYLPIKLTFKVLLLRSSPEVLNGYDAPFPSHLYKGGAAQWPLLVPLTSSTLTASEMQETREFLSKQCKQKVLFMYSEEDVITKAGIIPLRKILPNAPVKMVSDAGHYLQEDKGVELADNIISFIEDKLE